MTAPRAGRGARPASWHHSRSTREFGSHRAARLRSRFVAVSGQTSGSGKYPKNTRPEKTVSYATLTRHRCNAHRVVAVASSENGQFHQVTTEEQTNRRPANHPVGHKASRIGLEPCGQCEDLPCHGGAVSVRERGHARPPMPASFHRRRYGEASRNRSRDARSGCVLDPASWRRARCVWRRIPATQCRCP